MTLPWQQQQRYVAAVSVRGSVLRLVGAACLRSTCQAWVPWSSVGDRESRPEEAGRAGLGCGRAAPVMCHLCVDWRRFFLIWFAVSTKLTRPLTANHRPAHLSCGIRCSASTHPPLGMEVGSGLGIKHMHA